MIIMPREFLLHGLKFILCQRWSILFPRRKRRCAVRFIQYLLEESSFPPTTPLDVGCLSQIMNKCEGNTRKRLRGVHGRRNHKQTAPSPSEKLFFWTNRGSERWMFSLSYSEMRKCCRRSFMSSSAALCVTRRCDGRETLFWWWCRYTS